MSLNKYNNLLKLGSWSTNDLNDPQILNLVGIVEKLMAEKQISDGNNKIPDHIPWNIHTSPKTSHTGCWKIPRKMRDTRPLMEINNGGAWNNDPQKFYRSFTSRKIMETIPTPCQAREEDSRLGDHPTVN